jgi:hypothetical protein
LISLNARLLILAFATALLGAYQAHAEPDALDRSFTAFLGGGMLMGSTSLSIQSDANPTTSGYSAQGYVFEGGVSLPLSQRFGTQLSGEYGQTSALNSINSSTSLEIGTLNYYSGKLGFFYGPFTLGGGYRQSSLTVKSIATQNSGYLESNYAGGIPLVYANISFDLRKRYRGTVEAQYVLGNLSGTGTTTSALSYTEYLISIRVSALFD